MAHHWEIRRKVFTASLTSTTQSIQRRFRRRRKGSITVPSAAYTGFLFQRFSVLGPEPFQDLQKVNLIVEEAPVLEEKFAETDILRPWCEGTWQGLYSLLMTHGFISLSTKIGLACSEGKGHLSSTVIFRRALNVIATTSTNRPPMRCGANLCEGWFRAPVLPCLCS